MNTKTIGSNLPSIDIEGSLSSYLTQIKKFPMLSAEEEYMLAKSWKDRGDLKSAQKLITSHSNRLLCWVAVALFHLCSCIVKIGKKLLRTFSTLESFQL